MAIVLDAHRLALADEKREVDDVPRRIRGIRTDPLDVAQPPLAVVGIVAAVTRAGREGLLNVVGDEDRAGARLAVSERCLEDGL